MIGGIHEIHMKHHNLFVRYYEQLAPLYFTKKIKAIMKRAFPRLYEYAKDSIKIYTLWIYLFIII